MAYVTIRSSLETVSRRFLQEAFLQSKPVLWSHSTCWCFCRHAFNTQASNKLKVNLLKSQRVSLKVLGNGAAGNARGVVLATPDKSYLFNCGEGMQRLSFQFHLKLSRLEQIFTTSNEWHNISGVPGLALACYDAGSRHLKWHGLPVFSELVNLWTDFDLKLKRMKFEINDVTKNCFEDDLMQMDPVLITVDSKFSPTIAYICKLRPKPGVFSIDKCFNLKVPRHLVNKLEQRQDLVLEDRIVRASDVHTPDEPQQIIVFVDCPTVDHVNSLVNHLKINELNSNINLIVHFTSSKVVADERYQNWLKSFANAKHVIINEDNSTYCLNFAHIQQIQLNLLNESIFPLLKEQEGKESKNNIIYPLAGVEIILRPSDERSVSLENVVKQDISECRKEVFLRENFEELYKKFKVQIELSQQNNGKNKFPEVVFLGTGSALPGCFRNVSSVLINITEDKSILFDCGEDTFGQLYRLYGSEQINSIMTRIKAIFISHIHSDHHFGMISIIKKHYQVTGEPILLLIPPLLSQWLGVYNKTVEDLSNAYFILNTLDLTNPRAKYHFLPLLGLNYLRTIPVIHCSHSFGIKIETIKDKFRIVYSGDAIPSDSLVNFGYDCDLLIHEATYEDALKKLARGTMHSTVSDAVDIAKRMKAKYCILTHFSQRYGKFPVLPDSLDDRIGLAFDNMFVRACDLSKVNLFVPVLKCLYARHLSSLEPRSEMFQRRQIFIKELKNSKQKNIDACQ